MKIRPLLLLSVTLTLPAFGTDFVFYDSTTDAVYQSDSIGQFGPLGISFTTGNAASDLADVKISLNSAGGTGTVTVSLYSNNASGALPQPGSSLTKIGAINDSAATPGNAIADFPLATPYPLTANTRYWIVVSTNNNSALSLNWSTGVVGTGIIGEYNFFQGMSYANMAGMDAGPYIAFVGANKPAPPPPPPPTTTVGGVVSASAFGEFSSVAPGSFIEIYGTNMAPDMRPWGGPDFSGNNAPTSLDGVSVLIGGQNAFVEYISSGQVNVQVPSNVVPGGTAEITVTNGTSTSTPFSVMVNPTEPGLLATSTFKINGNQYVVAQFADGTFVLPTSGIAGLTGRPAHPGDEIVIYGVGFGPVMPDIPAGQIVKQSNKLAMPFQMMFGTTPVQKMPYFGLAPNFVGLYQFNIVVPGVPDNDLVPLTFNLGGVSGTQTLFTAVHQ